MFGRPRGDEQKAPYARRHFLISGETVVPGTYQCRVCREEYVVPHGKITNLPVCPRCQSDAWDLA